VGVADLQFITGFNQINMPTVVTSDLPEKDNTFFDPKSTSKSNASLYQCNTHSCCAGIGIAGILLDQIVNFVTYFLIECRP